MCHMACKRMFIIAFFAILEIWKQFECSSIGQWKSNVHFRVVSLRKTQVEQKESNHINIPCTHMFTTYKTILSITYEFKRMGGKIIKTREKSGKYRTMNFQRKEDYGLKDSSKRVELNLKCFISLIKKKTKTNLARC